QLQIAQEEVFCAGYAVTAEVCSSAAKQDEPTVGAQGWRIGFAIAGRQASGIYAGYNCCAAKQVANENILPAIRIPGNEVVGQTRKGDVTAIRANGRLSGRP